MSYFDALTLAATVDELRERVLGGRIQRVLLPSPLSVALEIYSQHRRHHLLLSAHPRFARMHLSSARPSRGTGSDTPLLLLLRKYVNGGRIMAIDQPALERIALISIAKRQQQRNSDAEPEEWSDTMADDEDDDSDLVRCELIVEIMEQRSNIVLVSDENVILASARRVTPEMSRRVILPRAPYELPPPQHKLDPRQAQPAQISMLRDDPKMAAMQISRALVSSFRGLSPLAAREVVFRATGQYEPPWSADLPWDALAAALRGIWTAPWQPSLVLREGQPEHYAPYMLSMPAAHPVDSISAALDRYYQAREHLTDHHQRRDSLSARLNEVRARYERQHAALSAQLEHARGLEKLRWEGEMIFAYLHTIQPYQKEVLVEDDTGAQRTISLNPERSAVENAQERFRAYEKAKSAIAGVPERLREAELQLRGLDELLTMVALAEGFEALEGLHAEAIANGYLPPSRSKQKIPRSKAMPLRIESSDGMIIYVGRSATQNEMVTFKLGSPDDTWLHARNIPGGHVIIKSAGRSLPETTLAEAAALAAYYSKARNEAAVEIDYAPRSQVRRIRGGPPGLVSYHAAGTIRAIPRSKE